MYRQYVTRRGSRKCRSKEQLVAEQFRQYQESHAQDRVLAGTGLTGAVPIELHRISIITSFLKTAVPLTKTDSLQELSFTMADLSYPSTLAVAKKLAGDNQAQVPILMTQSRGYVADAIFPPVYEPPGRWFLSYHADVQGSSNALSPKWHSAWTLAEKVWNSCAMFRCLLTMPPYTSCKRSFQPTLLLPKMPSLTKSTHTWHGGKHIAICLLGRMRPELCTLCYLHQPLLRACFRYCRLILPASNSGY